MVWCSVTDFGIADHNGQLQISEEFHTRDASPLPTARSGTIVFATVTRAAID
jgi:hypothetical protein